MINKKLLAASVAAAFTLNANATIDLSASPADASINYSSEAVITTQVQTNGLITIVSGTNELHVSAPIGFALPVSTSRFVRFDLTNGEFETSIVSGDLTVDGAATASMTATKLTGGDTGDTSIIFQIDTDNVDAIATADTLTLVIGDLNISASADVSVNYTIHADLATAISDSGALSAETASTVGFSNAVSGGVTIPGAPKALVTADFTTFTGNATFSVIGEVTPANYVTAGTFNPADGTAVIAATLLDLSQALVFAGDFSFGTWTTATAVDCTTGGAALTLNTDKTTATSAATVDVTAADLYLCVDNATNPVTINRGSYSVTLVDNEITGSLGTITYDTTSVAIPYLTTFTDYNQRIYLINSSSAAANYSTRFLSEADVTVTPGTKATGIIPAGEMIAIKARDLVTLSGKTRTSATIEIEAAQAAITATSQTVNTPTGGTDTTALVVTQ